MKLRLYKACVLAGLLLLAIPQLAYSLVPVKGKVVNERGEVLPGVNILIKGSGKGAITNVDGSFSLQVTPDKDVLVFSYIGYQSVEKNVTDEMNIVLKEDAQTLGEVVVSTQKRAQSSIEVPAAVSALSGQSLRKLNLQQFDEVAQYIPGIQIQLQSPNNPGYVIRGVTSDDGSSNSQPRVSIFQDGVSISRSRASVVELYDLERVEVVKGPQGTLFGRGAEIGAIHVIRNKAVDLLSGEISLGYGTRNQMSANGFLNTPIVSGKVANRVAFSYDRHDGFNDNIAGGRLNGKSAIAVRNSTRFTPNENTTYDFVLDYQHDNYPGTSFKSKLYAPEGGDTDPNTAAQLERGKELYIKRHVGGATFLVDHKLSDNWKLSSISGFRAFKSDESFDADGTQAPILWCSEIAKGTQFCQEFRLNFDNKSRFTGFAGVSYFYENSSQEGIARTDERYLYPAYAAAAMKGQFADMVGSAVPEDYQPLMNQLLGSLFPNQTPIDENGKLTPVSNLPNIRGALEAAIGQLIPIPGITLETALPMLMDPAAAAQLITVIDSYSNKELKQNYSESSTNYGTNQAAEIFADGTFKLTKGLSLTAGLRGTYEHQKSGYESASVPGTFGILLYKPSNGRMSYSDDYFSWVGRVALNYMFKRNNAYISVSRGRRPGVITVEAGGDANTMEVTKLKPEIIYSYEAGLKGILFNGVLNYDLSMYYYDWSHFQTSTLQADANTLGLKPVLDDAGKAHSFGIEAGLRYSPCRYFSIFGNYAYIDGKFNDKDENGVEQEYAGNRFRLTPKNTFSAGIDVNIPVKRSYNIYVRPSYSYKSQVYFEDNNRADLTQDGYGLANFTAGVRFHPKNVYYEIGAFGKNVFDTKYIIDAGNSGDNIGMPTYVGGSRSIFGVQVKVGF